MRCFFIGPHSISRGPDSSSINYAFLWTNHTGWNESSVSTMLPLFVFRELMAWQSSTPWLEEKARIPTALLYRCKSLARTKCWGLERCNCSSRGPEFRSQHPCVLLTVCLLKLIPGELAPTSGFEGTYIYGHILTHSNTWLTIKNSSLKIIKCFKPSQNKSTDLYTPNYKYRIYSNQSALSLARPLRLTYPVGRPDLDRWCPQW